jgi:glycosyltransferase involved in cell wall biosynthesis
VQSSEYQGVSVLTPSRGYARFIRDAVLSVQRQARPSVEHIVQDGASADGTIAVLQEFGDLVRWRSEPDGGQSEALNRALSHAAHAWIGWLNADEFYLPDGLAVLAEAAARTDADVVYGDCVFVDERGRLTRLLAAHEFDATVLKRYGCFIKTCAALFRRTALPDRPWDERLRMTMDWELFLHLATAGARFHHVRYPVGAFRAHGGRVTAGSRVGIEDEYALLRQAYGAAGPGRWIGVGLHGFHKLTEGGYRREREARRWFGSDLRWFRPDVGATAWEAFLHRCYGRVASARS